MDLSQSPLLLWLFLWADDSKKKRGFVKFPLFDSINSTGREQKKG